MGDGVEHEGLLAKRLNYDPLSLPEDILVATCGVDTQKDRLEAQVMGWGHNYEAWVIEYKVFWGDPNAVNVWNELDLYLKSRFKTESGRSIRISATCIDSGGHHSQRVYSFTKPRQGRRIFAIKGASVAGKPIVSKPTFVGKNQTALYSVGTDTAKENIFARLNAEDDETTLHFPADLEEEYFKQLTAEKRITKWIRGRKSLAWKQIRPRNEALDVTVYNFAAIYILNPNFDVIEDRLLTGAKNNQDPSDTGSFKPPGSNFANSWK
jgi:phage terminase large subunit GpA-like protein